MKWLHSIFDAQRRHFEGDGKFARLYPIFEATETFFFIPGIITRTAVQIRDSLDVKRYMSFVLLALLPPFLFGIHNSGYQANLAAGLEPALATDFWRGLQIVLPIVVVSYATGFFWEFLFATVRGHAISEGFFVTGLLFPLTLPPTIPLWQVAVGISFGVVIGKEIFGGTGRNLLNPALTGRAFLFFAYPAKMSGDLVWTVVDRTPGAAVDAFSGATPLALAGLAEAGRGVAATLGDAGYSLGRLFLGQIPGSVAETSTLMSLIGALLLIVVGIASYRIILGGVLGVVATAYLLNLVAGDASSALLRMSPLYHLCMGGFAFGIAYMATDPVSAPGMEAARWIYGFAIGGLTVLIRVFNPAYAEGVMLAILFMNLLAPLLDHMAIKLRLAKRIAHV